MGTFYFYIIKMCVCSVLVIPHPVRVCVTWLVSPYLISLISILFLDFFPLCTVTVQTPLQSHGHPGSVMKVQTSFQTKATFLRRWPWFQHDASPSSCCSVSPEQNARAHDLLNQRGHDKRKRMVCSWNDERTVRLRAVRFFDKPFTY